jgi:positive regulator of sigma E activity
MAYCTHCGTQVPEDARFCQKCGQQLIGESESKQVSSLDSTVSSQGESGKSFLDDIREHKLTESIFISFLAAVVFLIIGQIFNLFKSGYQAELSAATVFGATWGFFIRNAEMITKKAWNNLASHGIVGALTGGLIGFVIYILIMFLDKNGLLSGVPAGLIWFPGWGISFALARDIEINIGNSEKRSISLPNTFKATLISALKGSLILGAFVTGMAFLNIKVSGLTFYWVLTLTGLAITLGIGWFTDKKISGK